MSYQQQPGGWQDPSWPAPNQPSSASHQGHPGYPPPASPAITLGHDPTSNTNLLATASLVISLVGLFLCGFPALIGAIMGHVARKRIRQRVAFGRRLMELHRPADVTPQEHASFEQTILRLFNSKNGVALAAIIVGWTGFVLWLGFWVPFASGFFSAAAASTPS